MSRDLSLLGDGPTPDKWSPPSDWKARLQQISPRNIRIGDRLLLPGARPEVLSWSTREEYLSGPVTWHTDLSSFRSGHGSLEGDDMTVHVTDRGWAEQFQYPLYGIDFAVVYVYREES